MLSFNSILGHHEQALQIRTQRAQLISSNLANIDTPHYKARDLDFAEALKRSSSLAGSSLDLRHQKHIGAYNINEHPALRYRMPNQRSLDGNTVEQQTETAEFLDNAMHMQATVEFISGKFKALKSVIKGE